jgi:hypothetical protein
MLINFFKIKFYQFSGIVIVSAILGYFLYQNNADKVNFVVSIKAGKLVSENYCNSYVRFDSGPILNRSIYANLENKFNATFTSLNPSFKGKVEIGNVRDRNEYQVIFGGKIADAEIIKGLINSLIDSLQIYERKSFEENFESLKLYCGVNVLPIFKYVPAASQDPVLGVNFSYSRLFLTTSFLSPFFLLYFLLVAFNYIKFNHINLIAKD